MSSVERNSNLKDIVVNSSRVTINYDDGKSSDYSLSDYKKVSIDLSPSVTVKSLEYNEINEGGSGGGGYTTTGYTSPKLEVSKQLLLRGNDLGEKLFSVGLLSDIHSCKENDNYANPENKPEENWFDEDDLRQSLTNFKNEGIKNIFACGDIMEHWKNHHPEFIEDDSNTFNSVMSSFHSSGLRLFSPTGNHDTYGLYETRPTDAGKISKGHNDEQGNGYNVGVKERIDTYWGRIQGETITGQNSNTDNFEQNSIGEELRYFTYNAYRVLHNSYYQSNSINDHWEEIKDNLSGWNEPTIGIKNSYSKLSYWMEKDNNIFICLSIDYGNDIWNCNTGWNDRMIRARQLIDYPMYDPYIKRLFEYAIEGGYTNEDFNYNYQYYHPNALIWVKEIIESNPDKNIFVFGHHFLPHKVGNNDVSSLPVNGGWSYQRIYPYDHKENDNYDSMTQKAKGSNALSGVEYWFIRHLTKNHKNVVWFSGHSHISWTLGADSHISNKDFSIVNPSNTDYVTYFHGKTDEQISSAARYKKVYTRSNNTPSNYDTAWWVALPSLSKPKHIENNDEDTIWADAEYTIMDIYQNGVEIKGYSMTRVEGQGGSNVNYDIVNNAGMGPSAYGLPDYTDGTAGNAIEFVLHNKTGKDVVFSGKLKFYITTGSSADWNTPGIDDLFEAHMCPPDDTSDGWPHYTKNRFKLGPNETKTIKLTKITKYLGDGTTVTTLDEPLSKYADGVHSFMSTDKGSTWTNISLPAIKLGHSIKSTGSDNPFLIHVEPIAASAAKIVIGRTYNLIINGARFDDDEWNWGSFAPSSDAGSSSSSGSSSGSSSSGSSVVTPASEDNGTDKIKIRLVNNTGKDICFNGKLKFAVAKTANDAKVNYKYGDPNQRDDAGNIDSEDAKLSAKLESIDAALCAYDSPIEVWENGVNITSNSNKTGHYVLNHYGLKAGGSMEMILSDTEAAKAIGKYFMAVEGNQAYMYNAGGTRPIGGGGMPAITLATTILSGKTNKSYRYKGIDYHVTSYAFMFPIRPVTDNGNPVKIEKGKTYIFNIYRVHDHYPMNWNEENPGYQINYRWP